MLATMAALTAGGVAGTLARFGVASGVVSLTGLSWPWGTTVVNLSGCFLAGLFDAAATRRGWGGPHGRLLLLTGFCGAYTTFSSLILELNVLIRTSPLQGAAYVFCSVAAGLALLRAGSLAGGL